MKGTKIILSLTGIAASILLMVGSANAAAYIVQPGDSLWKIAQTQQTTVMLLKQTNRLGSDSIYPGQKLLVPGPTVHLVEDDQSLWDISLLYGVKLEALIAANPQLGNPNQIWRGLSVTIPAGTKTLPWAASSVAVDFYKNGVFPLASGTYQTPIENNYSAERYWTTAGEEVRKHDGVDILAAKGTPIYSAAAGEIANLGWNEFGGWRVTIRVDSTTQFYYAHLSGYAPGIGKGSAIAQGQLIGYVGSTGYGPVGTDNQFEPHLHFGVYKTQPSWHSIDPFTYLKGWESRQK